MAIVAIIGNSLTAPTPIHALAWPAIAAPCMPGVTLTNWAVDGNTSFRQLASGQNALIAASKPDVILIGLNYNETIPAPGGVDNRTASEVLQDAFDLFDELRKTGAKMIHMQELSGRFATPEYEALLWATKSGRPWDGFVCMNYEQCIDAAALITPVTLIDPIHPARVTCHMQAAEIVGQLIPWFKLPIQLPQWASVEPFTKAFKAGDAYALAAAKSLTS